MDKEVGFLSLDAVVEICPTYEGKGWVVSKKEDIKTILKNTQVEGFDYSAVKE